jgi:ureidoglycolate hydrolase
MNTIIIEPLTKTSFSLYGDVIDTSKCKGSNANQGTAKRFNHLTKLVNKRKKGEFGMEEDLQMPEATLNCCIFKVSPMELPFDIKLLERHQFSSQMFIPMTDKSAGYLVIVAVNNPSTNTPDFSTLRVFRANSTQAINYKENIWHHPMVGLVNEIEFVCFVYERRDAQVFKDEDTEEYYFRKTPIRAKL